MIGDDYSLQFNETSKKFEYTENGKSFTQSNLKDGSNTGSLNQIQDGASGTFSFTGKNVNATSLDSTLTGDIPYGGTGAYSTAFGGKSAAIGKRSFAAGTTVISKGNYSAAFGDNSVSLAADSMATGYATVTKGLASFTAGVETVTRDTEWTKPSSGGGSSGGESGGGSGTEVPSTNVRGQGAMAVGVRTLSTGYGSISTGVATVSNGTGSFSAGVGTVAKETGSASFGQNTEANSVNTIVGGIGSIAYGSNSISIGNYTISDRDGEVAFGRFNIWGQAFSIGDGTSNENRSNAFWVDSSGNAYAKSYNSASNNCLVRTQELKAKEDEFDAKLINYLDKRSGSTPQNLQADVDIYGTLNVMSSTIALNVSSNLLINGNSSLSSSETSVATFNGILRAFKAPDAATDVVRKQDIKIYVDSDGILNIDTILGA